MWISLTTFTVVESYILWLGVHTYRKAHKS